MHRLHGSVHIGCIVGAAAQRQQLVLERLQQLMVAPFAGESWRVNYETPTCESATNHGE